MGDRIDEMLLLSSSALLKQKEYWKNKLSGDVGKTTFLARGGIDRKDKCHITGNNLNIAGIQVPPDLSPKLIKLGKNSHLSLYIILLAALKLLACRYSFNLDEEVNILSPGYKASRTGKIMNRYLVIRDRVNSSMTFKQLLLQVRQSLLEAYENQDYPLDLLMEELFDHPAVKAGERFTNILCLSENIHDRSEYDATGGEDIDDKLVFSFLSDENGISGKILYDPYIYNKNDVEQIPTHLVNILERASRNIDIKVPAISFLGAEEKQRLLLDFNGAAVEYPADKLLHTLFEDQVKRTPDNIAALCGCQQLTYRQLNETANRWAGALRRKGVTSDHIAGILADISLETVTGMIAVLKAGGAFLAIDPGLPASRIDFMLKDCNTSALLAKGSTAAVEKAGDLAPCLTPQRPPIADLESLAIPNRSLVNYEKYNQYIGHALVKNSITLQATRGCPYKCAYCHKIWSKKHVVRSAENIFEEVRLYYNMGIRRFVFIDDIFNLDTRNSTRFFRLIIENRLDVQLFFPNGLRGDLLTREYIDLMIEAGTVHLALALETASPRLQKLIKKNINLAKLRENIDYICEKYPGVILDLFVLYGFPTETEEEVLMSLDFLERTKWVHFPIVGTLTIFPNTDMEKLALENGISAQAIAASQDAAYYLLPDTLPFDKSFASKCQASFFNRYFLSKERLLQVLPYQMKVLTEDEMVQKYDSYLPVNINSFDDLLNFLQIERKELTVSNCLPEDRCYVPHLFGKMKEVFPAKECNEDAFKILLLDLSQHFSKEKKILYDVVEAPLGLMYLQTHLDRQFGAKVKCKIAKSRFEFDSYKELKDLLTDFKPDMIGIRTLIVYKDFFHKTVAEIRDWGFDIPMVTGGPYATSGYRTILKDSNVHLAVLGEGEITLAELIGKILENQGKMPDETILKGIPGLAFIPRQQERQPGSEVEIIKITSLHGQWLEESCENPVIRTSPRDLAYSVYTSGSTGKPKGVVIRHNNIVNQVTGLKKMYTFDSRLHHILLAPFTFDPSVQQVFLPLISGGKLFLVQEPVKNNLEKLWDFIISKRIDIVNTIPSMMEALVNFSRDYEDLNLEFIILAGEVFSKGLYRKLQESVSVNKIINIYGPAEATINTTLYECKPTRIETAVPIGKPLFNYSVLILDKYLNLLPAGVAGELCISGQGLARGYMNQPGITAEKFIPNPFAAGERLYLTGDIAKWSQDGNIEFIGRKDRQVKIRGNRVEPDEIESHLLACKNIKAAVVIARQAPAGSSGEEENAGKYLCAYYLEHREPQPELMPSVGDYFVWDDLLYYEMTHDKKNLHFRAALDSLAKGKTIVEVGTGRDAIMARMAVQAGAKKVYAVEILEEYYLKAKETVKKLGLEEKIIVIRGDAREIQLPEKVDVHLANQAGSIGSSEGAIVLHNNARRFLKKDGVVIPDKCITKIACASLPDCIHENFGLSRVSEKYLDKIFATFDHPFDVRLCVKNFPASHLISNVENFESLDFQEIIPESEGHKVRFVIHREARFDGFVLWLNLYTMAGSLIDTLKNEYVWAPFYIPVFYPAVDVSGGDVVEAVVGRNTSKNGLHPDYNIKGVLRRVDGEAIPFECNLPYFEKSYKKTPFYRELWDSSVQIRIEENYKELTAGDLRTFLSRRVPAYMVPSYFVRLERMPLTASGKIDRKALPEPKISSHESCEVPVDEIERGLAGIWQEVLGVEKVGLNENFFSLGGNSLNAIIMVSRICKHFNVDFPLDKVFGEPTIKQFADFIREAEKNIYEDIKSVEKREYYPQSSAQKRLFFLDHFENIGVSYNIYSVFKVAGEFDVQRIENALNRLIDQHESLRTCFEMADSQPVQRVHHRVDFKIQNLHVQQGGSGDDGIKDIINAFIRPFDLAAAPLLRVGTALLAEKKHLLLFDMHHIISDGTSMGLLVADFAKLYRGEELSPPEIQYKDFSSWQNRLMESGKIKEQADYWLNLYGGEDAGDIPVLSLPTDDARPPVQNFKGHMTGFEIQEQETRGLYRLTQKEGGTLFMVTLAIFNVLLARFGGQQDIIVGVPTAGRRHTALEKVIGMFVNTLAMRNYPESEKSFLHFLKEVKTNTLQAFENQDCQFEELIEKLPVTRDTSRNPLFDVKFVIQNMEIPELDLPDLNLKPFQLDYRSTKFDLSLDGVEKGGKLIFIVEYNCQLFRQETIDRFTRYFKTIVSRVLEAPRQKIAAIDMMTGKDKRQILEDFNNTDSPFPHEKTLQRLFEEQVKKSPDSIAAVGLLQEVRAGHGVENREGMTEESDLAGWPMHFTYRELNRKSNQVANYLVMGKGIQTDDRMGILMDRSIDFIIAIMGTLTAGAAYVPLDPGYPEERLEEMIKDAEIAVVISQKKHIRTLNRLQWQCDPLHTVLSIDSRDIRHETEGEESGLMDQNLWKYVGESAADDIEAGGWFSSYTGQPFTRQEMDQYSQNILEKLTPLLHRNMRVLEIGCASGISMFPIARQVDFYYGTDLSAVIIEKNKQRVEREGCQNIALACLPAHEIHRFEDEKFDLVIMNSVVHCFPGHNYFRQVFQKAVDLLPQRGFLFIGDVLDQDLKTGLVKEMTAFKEANRGKGYKTKTDWSAELFLSRSYFADLSVEFPGIRDMEFSKKIYTIENELTKFRCDVLISIDKTGAKANLKNKNKKHKYQDDARVLEQYGYHKPESAASPRSLAYVIYTSGSTGTPKGVMMEHRSVVNRLNWMQKAYPISKGDVILQKTTFTFDVSVWELFWWFLGGASVYLPAPGHEKNPREMIHAVEIHKVTTVHFVPSMLNVFLDYVEAEPGVLKKLEPLKQVFASGEALLPNQVKRFNRLLFQTNRTRLVNLYGPTEAAVDVSYFDCIADEGKRMIPIGKPIDNTRLYILDHGLCLQAVGVPGQLCISGVCLARGYLDRETLTREKFAANPFGPGERLYKTGDLARWLGDGNIEFLGRMDQQVKMRGFRIELGEIESQLLTYPGIKEAVVLADEGRYLCAYIRMLPGGAAENQKEDLAELREYLAAKLPGYMIPAFIIPLEKIPLTSSGKINRKALPRPESRIKGDEYAAPGDETEKILTGIWQEVLGLDKSRIGIRDNFFLLGGHSLRAVTMIARIQKVFQVEFPLSNVFSGPTIKDFARFIKNAKKRTFKAIEAVEKKEYYPQSSAQKRLFFLNYFENIAHSYNIYFVLTIEGDLDVQRFDRAVNALITRHESLRTSLQLLDNRPVQRVHGQLDFKVDSLQIQEEHTGDEEIKEILAAFIQPFNLAAAPLLRIGLGSLAEKKHLLVFDMHHIISDGTSMGILVKDFADFYKGEEPSPLEIQYKDFSLWQNNFSQSGKLNPQADYWLNLYGGEEAEDIPVLNLPTDYARPVMQSFRGSVTRFELNEQETRGLNRLAQHEGATLFMVTLALFNVLLARLSGQQDIIVGVPTAGRRHADLGKIIGMFVNTLALRNYPEGDKSFPDFLKEVKTNTLLTFENQDFQFEELIERISVTRDTSRNPLFDVKFAIQNMEIPAVDLQQMVLKPVEFENHTAKFDLGLDGVEIGGKLIFLVEYNCRLFKKETVERLTRYFRNIVTRVLEMPRQKIWAIQMMSAEDKKQILEDFNDTVTAFSREKTLQRLFEQQVEKSPDRLAVVDRAQGVGCGTGSAGTMVLTYRELNKRCNHLAHVLHTKGIKADTAVGIMVERSVRMIIGVMGILKAGGAYVPLDPEFPAARSKYILTDSNCKVLVTENKYSDFAKSISTVQMVIYRMPMVSSVNHKNKRPAADNPRSLAFVLYTSGSTGKPKGILMEHYPLVNLIQWMNKQCPADKTDTVLLQNPYTFDMSVWGLFGWSLSGSSVCLLKSGDEREPKQVINAVHLHNVTLMHFVPSMLSAFLDYLGQTGDAAKLASLKYVFVSGEVLSNGLVEKFYRNLSSNSRTKLYNFYGPTETHVVSCYECLHREIQSPASIPIGKPISNTSLYILSKDSQQLLPGGTAGELYIGGDCLARGYLNNPGLTAERFCLRRPGGPPVTRHPSPLYKSGDLARWLPDGNIQFLGRTDHQVKMRGFRVELAEIENQLLTYPGIKEALVVATEDRNLCAYIVPEPAAAAGTSKIPNPSELTGYLAEKLPAYMVPAFILPLEKIPLTANGKVNRKALPNPEPHRPEKYAAPTNRVEEILTGLWQEVLEIEKHHIGIHDNFFHLGGHSLRAIIMVSMIQKVFQVEFPVSKVFSGPTIRDFARVIKNAQKHSFSVVDPVEKREYYPQSSAQKRLFFLARMQEISTVYNMSYILKINGTLNLQRYHEIFNALIERHEPLRTSFELIGDEAVQCIHEGVSSRIETLQFYAHQADTHEVIAAFIRPFDLEKAPLLHIGAGSISETDHLLIFEMHHIIGDGTSMGILVDEFINLYSGKKSSPLKIQYKDYTCWQNNKVESGELKKQEEYWQSLYLDADSGNLRIPVLNLPTDYPRPGTLCFAGDSYWFNLEGALAAKFRALGAAHEVTVYMNLLAVFYILLYKYADQTDIVIGSGIAGRPHVDLQQVIGMFVNMLAIRNYPDKGKTYAGFLKEVKFSCLQAFENQDLPFDHLVDRLNPDRNPSRNPMFDVGFVNQNFPRGKKTMQGVTFDFSGYQKKTTKFDITLFASETVDDIYFEMEYSTRLFKPQTIEKIAHHYVDIIKQVVENPNIRLADIELLLDFMETVAGIPELEQENFMFHDET